MYTMDLNSIFFFANFFMGTEPGLISTSCVKPFYTLRTVFLGPKQEEMLKPNIKDHKPLSPKSQTCLHLFSNKGFFFLHVFVFSLVCIFTVQYLINELFFKKKTQKKTLLVRLIARV